MRKLHVVSERYVCEPCMKGQHGDCSGIFSGTCWCKLYKHNIQIREQQSLKKPRNRPQSSGTSGEIAMGKALQDAGILYRWQVLIKTRFSPYTFICDFLVPSLDAAKYLGLVIEVDGGFHFKTWGGRVANRRMAKDRAKQECLEAEGYRVLRIRDTEVKSHPDVVVKMIKEKLI